MKCRECTGTNFEYVEIHEVEVSYELDSNGNSVLDTKIENTIEVRHRHVRCTDCGEEYPMLLEGGKFILKESTK